MSATREWLWTLPLGLLWAVAACGGGDKAGRPDTTAMSSAAPAGEAAPGTAGDTAMGPAAAPAAAESTARTAGADVTAKAADTAGKSPAPKPAPTPTAAAPKPAAPKPVPTAAKPSPGAQSPQQVALGDSIFHGQVAGGTCTACHGQDAKGTAVAPNLTDSEWLNGDGSYDFIVRTITTGVPAPKQHPAPMPPKGGASLTDEQVKAAAAYVYSLSHKS
jgi:mono/diheme cytochrome c family protein